MPASPSMHPIRRASGRSSGVGVFGVECIEENYRGILVEGKPRANVFSVPRTMPSAPAGQISMEYGLRGPVFAVTSACASSNHALASAADQLRLGRADVMLAGGADAPLVYRIPEGLGSAEGAGPRHLPAFLGRPRRADHRRGSRHAGARNLRACEQRAARRSLPNLPASACRAMPATSSRRPSRDLPRRCCPALPTPASPPATSTTSTPTAPARRPTTRSRRRRSGGLSAPTPTGFRCPRRNPCTATAWALPAPSRRSPASWRSATAWCRRRPTTARRIPSAIST